MVFLAKPPKSFAIWYGLAVCELEEPGIMGPMTLLRILTATSNTPLLKGYLYGIEYHTAPHNRRCFTGKHNYAGIIKYASQKGRQFYCCMRLSFVE